MQILKRGISVFLLIVMLFSLIPSEFLPTAEAELYGNNSGVIQIGGVGSIHGGMLFKNNRYSYPVFRVILSRDKKDYLNGTQEQRDLVYNNYKVQYPDSKDMTSNTLFFWDSTLYNGAKRRSGVVGVTEYTYSGTDSINIRNTPEYTSLNIPLSTTTSYSTNNFKTKVMADVAAKKIVDIRGLSNYVWKNYLPTYEQALQNLSYIFADVGGGPVSFDVDNRINKFIGPYFTMESENLTREQKLDNSVGYGGLLADLYVVASADPNRARVAGAYAAALNDYFANSNVEEKPVALIIDTGMPIVVDSTDFGIQKCGFVMPTIDYMELGMLATNDMAISNGETFLKGIGKSGAGSTRQMLRAMAQTSVDRKPRSTLYTGKGYGIVRIADGYGGWNTTNIRTNHPLGRLWSVPQFDHERVDIEDDSVARFNYAKWYGFLELLALDDSRNIKGFMVVGNHSADPDPTFSFTVETTGRSTPDRCEREASPTSPNKIKLKLIGDSGVIAGLEDSEEVMKIKSNIVRTTISYADGSSIESGTVTEVMNMDTLESQINRTYNYTETLGYLQGGTIELSDYEIMEDKFTRLDTGAFVVAYKYTIDLELTLNGNVYNFKSDEIVAKSDSGTLDTATVTIKSYGDTVILPEDIEITKPASTNTTEVIDPSENENLYELTQMIRRYEYTSEGAEFAETKSNTPLAEEYEVMGGIPSNEEIYFSVGGSEFKVAMILQYWMNEHSRDRTYTMHFDSNVCEYNNQEKGKGDSWEGIDLPQAEGASQTTTRFEHATGTSVNYDGNANGKKYGTVTVTATWTGTIQNEASPVTETKSTNHGTVSVNPKCPAIVNNADYVEAVSQANAWLVEMAALTPNMKWTSASDKVERSVTIETMNIGTGDASTTQGDSGSGEDSFSDRDIMTGKITYSFSNPADTEASNSATANCSDSGDPPKHSHGSATATATASPDPAKPYTITATFTISEHALCGPCCEHVLPDLYDTWRQGLVYDFVKISQIRLYKLDQGSADGFEELTGVDKIFANVMSGNPTYFMNIAQLTEKGAMGDKIYPLDGSAGVFDDPEDVDGKGYTIFTNDLRRVSQSSRDGRIRYTLQEGHTPSVTFNYQEQGNGSGGSFTLDYSKVAASNQHDDVIYTIGKRSMNCDGMATTSNFGKSASKNAVPMRITGHENEWADGCLYTNILKTKDYSSYHGSSSDGYSYTPKELRDNDALAIGTYPKWESSYYEDYNHHVVRPSSSGGTNGEDKTEYSDKADNKDTQTAEWQCFDKARRTKVVATVISDFLILQTSGGDQSIIYYEKQTEPTEAQEHFQKVKITEEEIFNNNPLSIFNGVSEVCSKQNNGNLKDERIVDYIVVGGYNGQYDKPADKYRPYSLVTGEFLPFAGTGGTYDATKKTGTYNLWGGTQIKTILDSDPAKTISRPVRQATSQASSFKIYQDGIQILPTTANQLYEPKHGNVWYSQVIGYYSHDPNVYDAGAGMYGVWSKSNVNIGWLQKLENYNKYMEEWGNSTGVSYETLYYQTPEGERDAPSINSIVVYTPVSTEYAMVLNQSDLNINGELISRDQRVNAIDYPDMNDLVNALKVCPLDPALCEYRYLDCKYHEPTTLAEFDFSSTYQTTEKQVEVNGNNVEVIDIPVTKKNTYKDGANWVTTNLVTGVEYTLPTGFTVESTGKVGSGPYLSAKGTRWSIPLSSIGLSNSRTNKLEVSMDLTVEATGNNLMLVSFQNYGFVIDTTNLFGNFITRSPLRTDEIGAVQTMKGGSRLRNVHVTLVFGFNNIIDCTASINGVPTKVTSVTELREVWADVGDVRQLQAKNVALDLNNLLEDGPDEIARADIGSNINIGSWGSGNGYTANYYLDNLKIVLQGGTDEHNSTCYEKITVHATNKVHVHDDTCYAKEDIWTCDGELNANYQLGCNKAEKELICGLTESGSGVYNLVASDDDSGEGLEAYISYNLTRGQSVKIQMGGYSGRSGAATLTVSGPNGFKFVSGQQSYTGYFEGSGSYKYEFAVLTSGVYTFSTSNRTNDPYLGLYVRDGHRHVNTCYRTHVHSGTPGLDYPNGCYTKPTEHKHNNSVKVLTCTIPEGGDGKVYNYSYTGNVQSVTLPAGRYKLEVWGAQGGTDTYAGGEGGYSVGNLTLTTSDTLYIVVGGQGGSYTNPIGGYNGGGVGGTQHRNNFGAGGGGATHIALRSGVLSSLSSYKSDILLVAGGGGGADGNGSFVGAGGGLSGGGQTNNQNPGTQTSGGIGGYTGSGSFGQGGSGGSNAGGGGGGYYGGSGGNANNGAPGGSGYVNTSKLTSTSTSVGGRSGNGYARITNLDHQHTDACYSTTQSTCSKIPAGSLICNGAPNTITDFNVHVHDATCLTNYTDLSATTYQYLGKVQTYVVPWTDDYTIEAYGPSASGSAKAGYAKGTVHLRAGTKLYIYVGGTDGFNNYTTDVRTISKPTGGNNNYEGAIISEIEKSSNASRMVIAGTSKANSSVNSITNYTLTNKSVLDKGNDGNGRVIITPANTRLTPSIYQQIVSGSMAPDEAKKYLGGTLYDKIMKDSEKVLYTWSGWSTSNDKGFKALNQCSLTMNGNLVVKSTGGDPYFDVQLDNIPYQAITQVKVYLNNPVSTRGQIFLQDATGYYNEPDSVWSNNVTVGANNQVMTFDLRGNKNFSGNFTRLRFDLGSATGTMTVTKIEVLGYGSRVNGSGEASYVNTEKVVATAGTQWTFGSGGNTFNSAYGTKSITLEKGKYKLETWGASGGGDLNQQNGSHAGLGGYSVGEYLLSQSQTLYVHIGGQGQLSSGLNTGGGYNGGGHGGPSGYGGGGMTHISTTNNLAVANGFWNPLGTLIVAGGGGGSDNLGGALGPGGYSQQTILYSNASMIYSDNSGYANKFGNNGNGFTIGWEGPSTGGFTVVQINNPYNSTNATSMTLTMRGYKDSDTPGSIYGRFYIGYGSPNGTDFYSLYDSGNHNVYINNATDVNLTIPLSGIPSGNVIKFKAVKYGSFYRYHFALTNIKINTFTGSDDGSGGSGGGNVGGNAYIEGVLETGNSFVANAVNGGGCGIGGTQTTGYRQGVGESVTYSTDTGGAGAGWYGGFVTNHNNGGGAGGSGYIGGVSNGSMQNGIRSGNGYAVITALEDIKTGEITYTFTPLKITYTSPFVGKENIIQQYIDTIPEKVDGDYNPIWLCHMQPYNKHVCETTDENGNIVTLCQTYTMLNCSEPHHKGEHYAGANEICWSACGNDDNHKNTHTEVVDHNTGETVQLAEFLQMDAAFTVYFPNIGDFAGQPNKLGLASCTIDRCYGYEDGMNTTDWTREKRVKFPFDVIFEGQVHMANTWIELDVPTEYFNFYIPVSNNEIANGSVEFEVEAINCNTGVGVEVMPGIEYSSSISTDYADALQKFLDGYIDLMAKDARATGYQVPVAVAKGNTGAAPRPFGTSGYEYFYVDKAQNEESKLRNTMEKVGDQIESDFEGGVASDAICNHMSPDDTGTVICPHTGSTTGINYTVKPLTSNDNKVRVDNKMRSDSLESLHGGYKHFYLDVIGRIGNFAIVDTEDFRFSNFFKMPIVSAYDAEGLADASNWLVEGLVLKVDDSIQNYYLGDQFDIRGNPASVPTRWLDTYGTESWMTGTLTDINDTSRDINDRNLLSQILTADVNNIEVLKGEELRFGYDVYTSIVTFGNYDNAWVQVVPKYYALKVNDEDLTELYPTMPAKYNVTKGTYIPIDVYIDKDGLFAPINVFGNAGDGDSNKNNIELYDYVFNLDWTAESNRRNYTIEEKARTLAVCEEFKQIIYDVPEDGDAEGNANSEFNVTDYEIKEVNEWKKPQGKDNLLGTAQYIVMGPEHRTFIGDRNSYGYNVYTSQAGTTDFKTDKNPGSVINDILFKKNVQRWHGKIGLPSSSVFVPTGEDVTNDSINWLMNDNFVIVCTAEIIAVGDIWSIHYSQPWFKTMNIDGVTFGTSTHYPGHRVENANGESVPCPDCLPPIIAVYSSANSSIDDIEIIGSH